MKPIDERVYFQKKDKSVQFLTIIGKNKYVKMIFVFLSGLFFKIFRIGKKNKAKNIVIVSFLRLGDTVFSVPAVKTIIKFYPDYQVLILCYPESKIIYELAFNNLDIRTIDKIEFKYGRRFASFKARREIKKLNPGIIFDLTGSITSATLIFNTGAHIVAGQNLELFKAVYTNYRTHRTTPHLMDMYLDVVELIKNFPREKELYEFKTTIEPGKKIIIHPFAIRKAKEWNLNKYIELAALLSKDYEVEIIAPENYIDEDSIEVINNLKIPFNITHTIDDLINKLNSCSVFISNDSGPMYIAALLGKATFAIYGPTNPDYSLSFGKSHRFYRKLLDCSPTKEQVCYTSAGIYCTHHNCFNLMTTQEVYTSVQKFLDEIHIQKKVMYGSYQN